MKDASFNGGYVFTSGSNTLDSGGLTFTTAQSTRARVISTYTGAVAHLPSAGLELFSGMDADGEYAVAIGTSAPASAGMILLSLAGDVDGTPARKINFMGDGSVRGGLGTAALPTYSFIGDTDTGMYSGGANAIKLGTGGVSTDYFTVLRSRRTSRLP